MDKETYQDVMWLFHDLGRQLKRVLPEAEGDARALLKLVVENHQRGLSAGRNPFNWLKELQSTASFWCHLAPESDIPEDDIWRDLDTLGRVAKYLDLGSEFIESVQVVKEKLRAETVPQDEQWDELDVRSWIREEIAQQLAALASVGAPQSETGQMANQTGGDAHTGAQRGEHADRVRDFVLDTYIEPARAEGQKEVRVRAGDVDKALGYGYRRLPLICAALRAQKFLIVARVRLVSISGPPSQQSTNTTFTYELDPTLTH